MQKGFTLVEVLIVLVLLAVLAVVTLVALNPLEQVRRAKDAANRENATALLNAIGRYQATTEKNPQILASANSTNCNDIVGAGPVSDLTSLGNELLDWFSQEITKADSLLYVGFEKEGRTRVCYKVTAISSITKVAQSGCGILPNSYLCLPE